MSNQSDRPITTDIVCRWLSHYISMIVICQLMGDKKGENEWEERANKIRSLLPKTE